MALRSAIPVSFDAFFPRGAFVVGEVEPVVKWSDDGQRQGARPRQGHRASALAGSLGSTADPALGRVALYDEHCGDTYLNSEAEISYRPSAVQLLDDLSIVTAGVRRVVDGWKSEKSAPGDLPLVADLGSAATFLRALTAKTSDSEIASATSCPPDIDKKLTKQVEEVARLRTADPVREKKRLINAADSLELVADHLLGLDRLFGAEAQEGLRLLRDGVDVAQAAADAVSVATFGDEPLSGIGTPVWKALWQAAEKYSLAVYPEHGFPHTGDAAVCVLCQQPLDDDGAARLRRFHAFVSDTTTQDADSAKVKLEASLATLARQTVDNQPFAFAIATVEQSEPGFITRLQPILDTFRAPSCDGQR